MRKLGRIVRWYVLGCAVLVAPFVAVGAYQNLHEKPVPRVVTDCSSPTFKRLYADPQVTVSIPAEQFDRLLDRAVAECQATTREVR